MVKRASSLHPRPDPANAGTKQIAKGWHAPKEGWHLLKEVGSAAYTIRDSPQGTNAFIPYTTGKKVSSRWHESRPADLRDNRQRAPQKRASSIGSDSAPPSKVTSIAPLHRRYDAAAAYDLVSGTKGGESAPPPRGRFNRRSSL